MPPKTYKITRAGQFDRDLARLDGQVSRLDEFMKGLEDVLSRDPSCGKATKDRNILAFKMKELPGNPGITVYYFYTQNEVVLIFLRADGDKRIIHPITL